MFIAALFTIARTWKQPRCSLTDESIRKLWYIYTMEYYSAIINSAVMNVGVHMSLSILVSSVCMSIGIARSYGSSISRFKESQQCSP